MADHQKETGRDVPIEWVVPDSVLTSRTTNIAIQQSGPAEFIVSFFDLRPPIITGSLEEQLEKYHQIESIPAVCTARFFLSYDRLVDYSNVFKNAIDEFHRTRQRKKGE